MTIWLALIYVYKGILLLYGLFLAYETRNVVYAHLNDSRVIGICVYNVVVLSTIGAFLTLILNNEQYVELYAALSVCIIIPATVTTSLIFIPKVKIGLNLRGFAGLPKTNNKVQESIKSSRISLGLLSKVIALEFIFRSLLVSEIPGGFNRSQSCDMSFTHVDSPSGFTRIFILRESKYATRVDSVKIIRWRTGYRI